MKNRVKNLLKSLIGQYEQLIDMKFDENAVDAINITARVKFKHHLHSLETSIKQLVNVRNPIYTFDGFEGIWDRRAFVEHVKRIADGQPDMRFDDEWDRIAFIECLKNLTDGKLEPRFAKMLDMYSDPIENYYKLVEDIERKNVDFKRRTMYFLMLFDY